MNAILKAVTVLAAVAAALWFFAGRAGGVESGSNDQPGFIGL